MAYINESGGVGHTGPYWRRQMGTTLPGERTAAQLAITNLARQRMGLPPLGGPNPGRRANPAGGATISDPNGFFPPNAGGPIRRVGPTFGQGIDERHYMHPQTPGGDVMVPDDPNGVGPMAGEPGAAQPGLQEGSGAANVAPEGGVPQNMTDLEQLRSQLLNRFRGATQPSYGRDALRNYVQQHMQRRATNANQPRRPILPQRKAQKALPY